MRDLIDRVDWNRVVKWAVVPVLLYLFHRMERRLVATGMLLRPPERPKGVGGSVHSDDDRLGVHVRVLL